MARPRRNFKVTLSPRFPDKIMNVIMKSFKSNFRKSLKRLEESSLRIIKQNTPVRTGSTRDAWTVTSKLSSNFKAEIKLRNPLPAALIQDRGARASLGAYIPALGRRIRTGMHPGIRATRYIDRSSKEIKLNGKEEFIKLMNRTKREFGKIKPKAGGR